MAIFTGLVAFAPSLLNLIIKRADITWPLALAWVIAVGLWLLAWTAHARRSALLPLPIALFLTLIAALPVPNDYTWPRLAGIALALAVTSAAVSGVLPTIAWSVYAVALVALDYARDEPHAGHLSTSGLDVASTMLGIVVIPTAIAVVSRQWNLACEEADASSEASRVRRAQARAAERAEAARAAVDRRIHETVLNTLATIARSRTSSEAARAQCAQDLSALDSLEESAPRDVRGLLTRLLERHPVPSPTVTVVAGDVSFRDSDMADTAYAAVGEVLRNVTRHARATRTVIKVRIPRGHVTFIISDDGIGMDDSARQRFGMRRALIESVEASGGSVRVESRPGAGTTVTITLPVARRRSQKPPMATPSVDVLLGPPSVRVAMISALAIGIVLLIPTAATFSQPLLVAAAYLVFATLVSLIAVQWRGRRSGLLAWVVLVTMLGVQAAAVSGVQGCESAGGLHQVLFTTAAAMLLPPLVLRRASGTIALVLLVVVPTILASWALPAGCRVEALIPAVETSLWVVVLVSIIAALSKAFDRSSIELISRWEDIAETEARLLALQAADQRWHSVDALTRDLLADVADGEVSPEDPAVRSAAMRLEARIRSLFETAKVRSPELRACLEEVVEAVTAAGVPVTVMFVSEELLGTPRPDLNETLIEIGRRSARSGLHITLLDGELLVAADRSALVDGKLAPLEDTEDPLTAVAVIPWESVSGDLTPVPEHRPSPEGAP